ncbi:MAG TPA: hypothetical protein VFN37_13080 [Candidatus Baltobacteraceae bacterium]|nr:hypothetical protein [Candidatus Baltobacteraceae bacterium]
MKFLRNWLRVERPPGVALHATQTLELECPYDEVFAQCVRGIEDFLGGVVRTRDSQRGSIEATFGLIDSERLTCSLAPIDSERTRVIIESRRGARPEPAKPSQYVRALSEFLQSTVR